MWSEQIDCTLTNLYIYQTLIFSLPTDQEDHSESENKLEASVPDTSVRDNEVRIASWIVDKPYLKVKYFFVLSIDYVASCNNECG